MWTVSVSSESFYKSEGNNKFYFTVTNVIFFWFNNCIFLVIKSIRFNETPNYGDLT